MFDEFATLEMQIESQSCVFSCSFQVHHRPVSEICYDFVAIGFIDAKGPFQDTNPFRDDFITLNHADILARNTDVSLLERHGLGPGSGFVGSVSFY